MREKVYLVHVSFYQNSVVSFFTIIDPPCFPYNQRIHVLLNTQHLKDLTFVQEKERSKIDERFVDFWEERIREIGEAGRLLKTRFTYIEKMYNQLRRIFNFLSQLGGAKTAKLKKFSDTGEMKIDSCFMSPETDSLSSFYTRLINPTFIT